MSNAKRIKNKYAASEDARAAESDLKNEIRKGKRNKSRRGYSSKEKGKAPNDISWHAKSAQLLHDASCIPWSWATGRSIRRSSVLHGAIPADANAQANMYLPGIEVIRTVMTPGVGGNGETAINRAANSLYTDIRRELKSANQYEASDVIIYMMAVAEIIAFISWATRLYGTVMSYSFANEYMPDALIKAQGVDPQSLKHHPAEFRGRLNTAIAYASKIWIPKGFDYLTRARWEYANYYSEGENIKDQLYMLAPGLFRKFVYDESRDYAGSLEPFFYITGMHQDHLYTYEEICEALEEMISALIGDTDFNNIAGDLFNRYGAGGVETFSLVPDGAIVQPVFSIEVLEQFQNAKCCYPVHAVFYELSNYGVTKRDDFFRISQNETDNILVIPRDIDVINGDDRTENIIRYGCIDGYTPILNVHDSPSEEKTMLVSRMSNVITDINAVATGGNEIHFYFRMDVSAEWVVGYEFITFTGPQLADLTMFASAQVLPAVGSTYSDFDERYTALKTIFHYSPLFVRQMVYNRADVRSYKPEIFMYGEQDIVAPIKASQLEDINRVDLLSLFAVPDVGAVVK